jgi:hypothetical protein
MSALNTQIPTNLSTKQVIVNHVSLQTYFSCALSSNDQRYGPKSSMATPILGIALNPNRQCRRLETIHVYKYKPVSSMVPGGAFHITLTVISLLGKVWLPQIMI